jgi:putative SOS response-associated peptidase YedK
MCGRFSASKSDDIIRKFGSLAKAFSLGPRYNIAPSQMVAGIRLDASGQAEFVNLKWGLIPSWASDPKIAWSLINARGETVKTKPAFRDAFKRRRCLILADGFFEWAKEGDKKLPFHFRLKSHEPFAFAGLWESWTGPGGEPIETCTIITCEANQLVKPVHGRMPVILAEDAYALWLDAKTPNSELLLLPYPANEMETYPVSTLVNSPRNESAECVAPLTRA